MPKYMCTCKAQFGKWGAYRNHCRQEGHVQLPQNKAMIEGGLLRTVEVPPSNPNSGESDARNSAGTGSASSACLLPPVDHVNTGMQEVHQVKLPSGQLIKVEIVKDVFRARAVGAELLQVGLLAFDCEGVDLGATGELTLLQVAFFDSGNSQDSEQEFCVKIFDICALGHAGMQYLKDFLEDSGTLKLVHDVHQDAAALSGQFGVRLAGIFDTQLAHEATEGKMLASLNDVLRQCGLDQHTSKDSIHKMMRQTPDIWKRRPLSPALVSYAAQDVVLLLHSWPSWRGDTPIINEDQFNSVCRASTLRCGRCSQSPDDSSLRSIIFDGQHRIRSYELLSLQLTPEELSSHNVSLQMQDSLATLVNLLPPHLKEHLGRGNLLNGLPPAHKVRDIVLDLAKRPRAFFGHREMFYLCQDPSVVVTKEDLEFVSQDLQFGPDRRAGIDGCLHRISGMFSKTNEIYGLTLRVGRSILGNTNLMADILLGTSKSILILGTPGCGKTTIIREAARMLSHEGDVVVVVDTSNEICGDGLVPHASVGEARRMMVPKLEEQATVLIEAVQNHTPDAIIVDEIGRPLEVDAARTVKERGVRILGSAHGNLRSLVKNAMLNQMVGGVENVTVGDAEARRRQGATGGEFSKLCPQRVGPPVFDVAIELKPGYFNKWHVVPDVAKAVDCILSGRTYPVQVRTRDPATGRISLELSQA